MPSPLPWRTPHRRPWRSKRLKRDAAFFAAAFAALFIIGYVRAAWADVADALDFQIILAVVLGAAFVAAGAYWRLAWHLFANRFLVGAPVLVAAPWVIDGDTIDDRQSGVRYRLANIDAPEIAAGCYKEAERAQLAKWVLVRLVRAANRVSVRRTFRTDRFGRRVAFLLVDGEDAGRIMIERGLAVPWRGWRRRWCGPHGGLAKIAKAGAMAHRCKTCHAGV